MNFRKQKVWIICLAVVGLFVIGAAVWYLWQGLPDTSGMKEGVLVEGIRHTRKWITL